MTAARADAERKFAVLLFADLSGYTELCQLLDPEDVVATVHPVMAELRGLTEARGGVICSVAGDGFLAVFGVPNADPDAGANAVAAAESMRRLVLESNTAPRPMPFPDVHIGIAAGEVLVVPSGEPPGFSLVGPAVNLAARLCDAATAGVILVDDTCRTLAGATGTWLGPEPLDLRGHSEPVSAYRVGGESAPTARVPAPLSPAAFVGRAGLLGALDAELAEVTRTATSKVVLVTGEPGVGKTRLVEHWLNRHDGLGARWVRCAPAGAGLVELMRQIQDVPGDGLPADAGAGSSPLNRDDPFPAALAATRTLLAEASREAPLVVVVDDLHAADATLPALVEDLRSNALDVPLLLVASWRSGEPVGSGLAADHAVSGLSQVETTSLLAETLGATPSAELGQALYARTSGHPLMMLLTAAYLTETDALQDGPDGVRPRSPGALATLPTTVRLSVAARLDRLPASVKRLLQELSTCGAAFSAAHARGLSGRAATAALPTAIERGLLVRADDELLRFGHDLVREVAYTSLPRGVRARLHRKQLTLPEVAADVHQRAYHALAWLEHLGLDDARERHEAVETAFDALHDHVEVLFTTQAQSAYDAVKRAMPVLAEHAELAPTLAVRLYSLAATALVEIWQFEEAERVARGARELAARCGVGSDIALDAALVHAIALARLRRQHAARQTLDDVVVAADATGDRVRRGRALHALALTWRHESYPKMVALQEEAFVTLRDAGAVAETADIARLLAYITGVAPARLHERWLAMARELTPPDDVRGQASLARTVAMASIYRLELDTAREAATRAVELGSRLAAYDVVGDGLSVLVDCAVAIGDHDEFVAKLTELGEMARRTGNSRVDLFTATTSALGLLRMGRLADSTAACDLALDVTAEFGSTEQAEVYYVCALVARDRGDFATALAHLARARVASGDGYFIVEELLHRVHEARLTVAATADVSLAAIEQLQRECLDAGAPRLASYAAAVGEQAALLRDQPVPLVTAADGAMVEEQALRADNQVLRARLAGDDADVLAKQAVTLWSSLGATVWLAAAQHRSGDGDAALQTLEAIGAGDAARAWVAQS
jgi:class 3 adenylate cyclase/tetratricopeptide (TPR) repeat protein